MTDVVPDVRDTRADVTEGPDLQERSHAAVTPEDRCHVARRDLGQLDPDPITGPRLPAFPVEALPLWLRGAVLAVAEGMQTPVDLPAMTALGALSAAAAGRVEVVVRQGWRETLSLYIAVAAESSERKSPVHRAMTAPLRDAEERLRAAVEAERAAMVLQRQVADDQAEQARIQAVKSGGDKQLMADALDAEGIAAAIEVPELPRLVAGGDATPEAIVQLLVKHQKIAIADTEGGLFDMLAGRHSHGVKNLDAVLQAYSGDPIAVERRGRDAEFVPRPALTLILAVQPIVVARVVRDPEMTGRGLAARFLLAMPAARVGHRLTGHDVPLIPASVMLEYSTSLGDLAVDLAGWSDPAQLMFSRTALDKLFAFETAVERRLARGGDLRPTGAWGGKFVGQTVRLAALLHLAEEGGTRGPRTEISLPAVEAALRIADYLAAHALAAFSNPTGGGESSAAAEALGKLAQLNVTEFSIRDLQRRLRSAAFSKAADVLAAVEALEDLGWVGRVDDAGRRWVTHPRLGELNHIKDRA